MENLSKRVKRNYYAEEQSAEMQSSKIQHEEKDVNREPIRKPQVTIEKVSEAKTDKILKLEAEINILKASNEKYKAQTRKLKIENDNLTYDKKVLKKKCVDAENKIAEHTKKRKIAEPFDDEFYEHALELMETGWESGFEFQDPKGTIEEVKSLGQDKEAIEDTIRW